MPANTGTSSSSGWNSGSFAAANGLSLAFCASSSGDEEEPSAAAEVPTAYLADVCFVKRVSIETNVYMVLPLLELLCLREPFSQSQCMRTALGSDRVGSQGRSVVVQRVVTNTQCTKNSLNQTHLAVAATPGEP